RGRHTRFKCDWSSDVCSSDLVRGDYHWSPFTFTKPPPSHTYTICTHTHTQTEDRRQDIQYRTHKDGQTNTYSTLYLCHTHTHTHTHTDTHTDREIERDACRER